MSGAFKPLMIAVLFWTASVGLATDAPVHVVGLFKDKAVVLVNGRKHVLSVGETSPEGITLVRSSSEEAVLEIDGFRRAHTLGGEIQTIFEEPAIPSITLYRNIDGMFTTVGTVNGLPVDFLLDTGASTVALSARQAKRLGVRPRANAAPVKVKTAAGIVTAHPVTLRRIELGSIGIPNVDALVLEGQEPHLVLLGMSFLRQLELHHQGDKLELRKRY